MRKNKAVEALLGLRLTPDDGIQPSIRTPPRATSDNVGLVAAAPDPAFRGTSLWSTRRAFCDTSSWLRPARIADSVALLGASTSSYGSRSMGRRRRTSLSMSALASERGASRAISLRRRSALSR